MTAIWRRRFGQILYWLAVRLRGEHSVYRRIERLQALERAPRKVFVEKQQNLLAEMLSYSLANVPFYRSHSELAAGLNPSNAADRLREMPILEKEHLQEHSHRLRSEAWEGRQSTKTTGGSTGRPVTLLKNPAAIAQEMSGTWTAYGWFGIKIGDPWIRFWGQPQGNLRRRLRYLAADVAVNRKTLSAFGYDASDLDAYVGRINRFRPKYLYGYVSALEDLARHMVRNGVTFDGAFLQHVVTTAEVLTAPQRGVMEDAFGVSIQNEYGCGEMGPIAFECPAGSLHLLPVNQFVEIVDDAGNRLPPGEPGSIVLTDLTNRVMPLIRYRVGDMGSLGPACSCGRSFPVLSEVFGREYDFVETVEGRRYHGEFFMYLFEDLRQEHPEIGQFQVVQEGERELTVKVVLSDTSHGTAEADIKAELQRRLSSFECSVERVERLTRRPSGKMRVVENRLNA